MLVCPHSEILQSKNKQLLVSAKNRESSHRRSVEQKNPDTKMYMLYDCIYMKFKNRPNCSMVIELRILFDLWGRSKTLSGRSTTEPSGGWKGFISWSGWLFLWAYTHKIKIKIHIKIHQGAYLKFGPFNGWCYISRKWITFNNKEVRRGWKEEEEEEEKEEEIEEENHQLWDH